MSSHLKSHILAVKRSSNIFAKRHFDDSWKGWGRCILVLVMYFVFGLASYITSCEKLQLKCSLALDLLICTCGLLTHSSFLSSAGFPSGCYKLMLWSSSRCQSGLLAVKDEKHG